MTREEWRAKVDEIIDQCEKEKQERYKELGIENKFWFGKERKYCSDLVEKRNAAIDMVCEQYKEEYYKEHPEEAPKE